VRCLVSAQSAGLNVKGTTVGTIARGRTVQTAAWVITAVKAVMELFVPSTVRERAAAKCASARRVARIVWAITVR
jgi:hypothetical protein